MTVTERYALMDRARKVGLTVLGARNPFARMGDTPTDWTGRIATEEYAWDTVARIIAQREATPR